MSEVRFDLVQIRRDIEAEVRARRAAGVYPAGFERELDDLFARFAPPEASDDLHTAIDRVEEYIAIDPVIPTASRKPGIGLLKRIVAKLIGWYHAFVAQQVTAAGAATAHAIRLLGRRVEQMESVSGHSEHARVASARVRPARDDGAWSALLVEELGGCRGRVAVCECGDGDALATLAGAGVDAYGVEPRHDLADAALARGLEVRVDDAVGHLGTVGAGELAAVVLRACVERLPVGELLDLVDLVATAVAPGGRVVVLSVAPAAWGRERTAIEADLATGRPLHAQTWADLLGSRGFADISTRMGADAPLATVPTEHPDAALVNDNLARVSAALFGPDAYAVVATRASVS